MQRSGQCKCGVILTFEQGPSGYKGRCPKCGAVVRLRIAGESPTPVPAARSARRPPRPSDPRLSVVALREPGPVAPGETDPDATTPFEPIDEIQLEPWTPPPARAKPSFLRLYGLPLAAVAFALIVAGAFIALWLRAL
jgi:hypothetical protein